ARLEGGDGTAVVEVGSVNGMAGPPQLVREGVEALRLTLCVVEEQHLRHLASFARFGPTEFWLARRRCPPDPFPALVLLRRLEPGSKCHERRCSMIGMDVG